MRTLLALSLSLLLALGAFSCGSRQSADEDEEIQEVEAFLPQRGDGVQQVSDVPGVTWAFDTIFGLCGPDTLVLWLSYEGHDYMTNVYGIDNNFQLLTPTGHKRLGKKLDNTDFEKIDFSPMAQIVTDGSISRAKFHALRDTAYARASREMCQVVFDFFNSKGMVKYMGERLANNWRIILLQSEMESQYAPNPLNSSSIIEFAPGSITVQIADRHEGIVEVSAYCNDSHTLGYPGWAYWTVFMCRENGQFKVKEMPAQHRKFVTG